MRLIDVDATCREIARKRNKGELDFSPEIELMLIDIIQKQPTAYDVEKVVGQINAIEKSYCDIFDCNKDCKDCDHGCLMRKIVEEVKEGGLNATSNN